MAHHLQGFSVFCANDFGFCANGLAFARTVSGCANGLEMCCKGTKNISPDDFFPLRSFFFTVKNGILPKNYRSFRLIIRQIVSFAALPHRFATRHASGRRSAPRRLPVPLFFTDLPALFRAVTKSFRLPRPALKSRFPVFFSSPDFKKTNYRWSFYGLSKEFLRGIEGIFTGYRASFYGVHSGQNGIG